MAPDHELLLATVDDTNVWLILLTGGGLAIVGTVLGAVITQIFTVRVGREARREARRLSVKSFQRDSLVALQDTVVALFEATGAVMWSERTTSEEGRAERHRAITGYNLTEMRLRMLASRVRDDELRSAVENLLDAQETLLAGGEVRRGEGEQRLAGEPPPADWIDPKEEVSPVDMQIKSMQLIYERAGTLIRTLDAIDEPT